MFICLSTGLEVTDLELEDNLDSASPVPLSIPGPAKFVHLDSTERSHFTVQLVESFWLLHNARPVNPQLAPVCLPGILFMIVIHIEKLCIIILMQNTVSSQY